MCDKAILDAVLSSRVALEAAKKELKIVDSRKKVLEKAIKALSSVSRLSPTLLNFNLYVSGFDEGNNQQNRVALIKDYRCRSDKNLLESVTHFRENATQGKKALFFSSSNASFLKELEQQIKSWGFTTEIRAE